MDSGNHGKGDKDSHKVPTTGSGTGATSANNSAFVDSYIMYMQQSALLQQRAVLQAQAMATSTTDGQGKKNSSTSSLDQMHAAAVAAYYGQQPMPHPMAANMWSQQMALWQQQQQQQQHQMHPSAVTQVAQSVAPATTTLDYKQTALGNKFQSERQTVREESDQPVDLTLKSEKPLIVDSRQNAWCVPCISKSGPCVDGHATCEVRDYIV